MRAWRVFAALACALLGAVRPCAAARRPLTLRKAAAPCSGGRRPLALSLGKTLRLRGGAQPIEVAGHTAIGFWAFSMTVAAARARSDAVGGLVIAFFGALGGSTMRDVLLGRQVFWIKDPAYLATLVYTSLATFVLFPRINRYARFDRAGAPAGRRILLEAPDAIGMAFYSVYGAHVALACCGPEFDAPSGPLVAVVMGLLTSTGGCLVGDPLCGKPIRIIQAGESLYAFPALLAALIYALWKTRFPQTANVGAFVAFGLAFLLRMAAFTYDLKMPVWLDGRQTRNRAAPLFEQIDPSSGPMSAFRGW